MRRFKQLSRADRLKIEALDKAGIKAVDIAAQTGVHHSTIYRELKRGRYIHTNSDLTEEERYSPDIAEEKYQQNLRDKGPGLKIGNDRKLAEYIENKILNEDYSPGAVLGEIKANEMKFDTTITKATLYSYIEKGVFYSLSNKDLPVKGTRTKKYKKVQRKQARAAAGESIEKRSEEVLTREEFGHWEMDTVVGKRGESKNSLLVMTERKTRDEIVIKLFEHTMQAVVSAVNTIERKWGDLFCKVFKTITVDNGTEFSDYKGIKKSVLKDNEDRTKVYYCHPYSSYERGSNENQNKLIRRKIPKGTNFDDKTEDEIRQVQDWMNNYPREMFEWRTPRQMFEEELAKLA